jgi:hypothetical protein
VKAWGRRFLAGSTCVLLVLAGCGQSSGTAGHSTTAKGTQSTAQQTGSVPNAPAGTVSASAQGVTATLHAGTHHPKVGQAWPIQFTVTRAGRPVRASVSYEYLFGGAVVARRSHYTFIGRFSDIFEWPASAVGYPLMFRAVIVSEGATMNLDYPVQVTT